MHKQTFTKSLLVGSFLSLTIASPIAAAFDLEETRKLTLDVTNIESLQIDAGAGFLVVAGDDSTSQITLTADLKVDKDNFILSLEAEDNVAQLIANPNPDNDSSWWGDSPTIDLTVTVPKKLFVKIDDGSGELTVKHLANGLKVKDGSGSMSISDIIGDVFIDDGSGSMDVEKIHGSLEIEDGSGSIYVKQVSESVEIDDGSGGIDISDIGGTLKIDDGSGSMLVVSVKGHVTIDDGSGSITLDGLESGVSIIDAGSGGLSMNNVNGKIENNHH